MSQRLLVKNPELGLAQWLEFKSTGLNVCSVCSHTVFLFHLMMVLKLATSVNITIILPRVYTVCDVHENLKVTFSPLIVTLLKQFGSI